METQANIYTKLLVEPLTRREVDILKLLALNLTNREIADRLTLALSSVKWYTTQIYAKLGVENRHQAVERARELGILPISAYMRPTHNLPRQISRFIGREKEIVRVVELIREHSLITLTGPGGVGKTRLALACAEELLDDFINGIWFIEIAPLSDPLLVERTLADVLGVREDSNRSRRESLIRYLQERQCLLIFDNCEHMLDACADLSSDLLKSLPNLKILVSSREPLGLTGEAIFRVPSLSFPKDENTLEQIEDFEAVRLFQERARAAQPDFHIDEADAAFVAQICRRLDGIPLAIELAASRVVGLDLEHIAARLDQAFRLLSGGSRTTLERHRTLRAAVDWSYNLLGDKEQLLLRRMSIFVGGFTLEAAEAVCSGEPIQQDEILNLLFQLSNKSMIVVEQTPVGATRYRLLETIRQYAEEKQHDPNEIKRLRQRHCDWFVQFTEFAEPKLKTHDYQIWMKKLTADVDNLRAALEWSIGQNADPGAGMRIINAIVLEFWSSIYYAGEVQRWIEKGVAALACLPSVSPLIKIQSLFSKARFDSFHNPPDVHLFEQIFELCQALGKDAQFMRARSLLLFGLGLAYQNGDVENGLDKLNEAEAIARGMGEPGKWVLAVCLVFQTSLRTNLGDLDGAQACLQEGSAYFQALGSSSFSVDLDISLGEISYRLENYEAAESHFKKAISAQLEINYPDQVDDWTRKLGDVYRAQRKFEQAKSTFHEALRWTIDMANWNQVVWLLCSFAFTMIDQARDMEMEDATPLLVRGACCLSALQPVMQETGEIIPIEYKVDYDTGLEILRQRLEPAELEAAWTKGCSMNRKQVVTFLQEEE